MVWSKHTDGIGTHPRTMALTSKVDERMRWEVFGFFNALVGQAAQHMTDYAVDEHTVATLGLSRTAVLVRALRRSGHITGTVVIGGVKHYLLLDDPEYVHLRRASEVAWEKQRRDDNRNPDLTVPVRERDGDACRYCGQIVSWRARRGKRGGTYDHRVPGAGATVETSVVSCLGCNATRGDDPQADVRVPLLPVPAEPYYSQDSADFLAHHGVQVAVSTQPAPQQARSATDPATPPQAGPRSTTSTATTRDPATSEAPRPPHPRPADQPGTAAAPATPPPAGTRSSTGNPQHHSDPGPPPAWATDGPDPAQQPRPGRSRQVDGLTPGTGRDGKGRPPTGAPAPAPDLPAPPPAQPSPARRPRGRRGSRRPSGGDQ